MDDICALLRRRYSAFGRTGGTGLSVRPTGGYRPAEPDIVILCGEVNSFPYDWEEKGQRGIGKRNPPVSRADDIHACGVDDILLRKTISCPAGRTLVQTEGDAGLGHVVGGDLDTDSVAYDEADEALAHFAGDVGQELMAIGHLDAEHGAGEHGGYHAFELDFTLAIVINLLGLGNRGRGACVARGTRAVRALLRLAAAIIGGICHYVVLNLLVCAACEHARARVV